MGALSRGQRAQLSTLGQFAAASSRWARVPLQAENAQQRGLGEMPCLVVFTALEKQHCFPPVGTLTTERDSVLGHFICILGL